MLSTATCFGAALTVRDHGAALLVKGRVRSGVPGACFRHDRSHRAGLFGDFALGERRGGLPGCGAEDPHYNIGMRQQWRCKKCLAIFWVTKTSFGDQKLGCRKLLMVIFAFLAIQKGLAALVLRRIIGG